MLITTQQSWTEVNLLFRIYLKSPSCNYTLKMFVLSISSLLLVLSPLYNIHTFDKNGTSEMGRYLITSMGSLYLYNGNSLLGGGGNNASTRLNKSFDLWSLVVALFPLLINYCYYATTQSCLLCIHTKENEIKIRRETVHSSENKKNKIIQNRKK